MIGEAIVGFVDILGYKTLVENHMNNIDVIQWIEKIIKRSSFGLKEKFKLKPFTEAVEQAIEQYTKKIVDVINIRFIADTVMFTLPLSKINFFHPDFKKEETISHCIYLYFNFISTFCTLFIAKTGLFLRGGLAIGPHYESEDDDLGYNLFIFSKAYLKAYHLEKEADKPRIIIDKQLLEYLDNLVFEYMDMFSYDDEDKKKCFDICAFLQCDELSKEVLQDIKNSLTLNLKTSHDKNVLNKLIYFAKYHNKKVKKVGFNSENQLIDISNYERRVIN